MGSRTLFGTIESQVLLRVFGFLGFSLLFLWALSPLGGQASLRLLSVQSDTTNSTIQVRYMSTNQTTILFGASASMYLPFVTSLYSSSLLSAKQLGALPSDPWGNIKIPRIESLDPDEGPNGWRTVPPSHQDYSSFIGLPLINVSTSGQVTFSMESAYLNWNCLAVTEASLNGPWTSQLDTPWGISNFSKSGAFHFLSSQDPDILGQSIFLDTNTPFTNERATGSVSTPRRVLFGSQYARGIVLANFTVTQSRVESRVSCLDGKCAVTQMRNSQEDHLPPDFTFLENSTIVGYLFGYFGLGDGITALGRPTAMYIQNQTYNLPKDVDLVNVSASDFSTRLGVLFNTFYVASLAPMAIPGTASPQASDYVPEIDWSQSIGSIDLRGSSNDGFASRLSTATVVQSLPDRWNVSPVWLASLIISASVLFALGIWGTIAKYRCLAPDIMGYVSSFTRDNQFCSIDPPGSALDAFDRARLLKNAWVRIGDVKPGDSTGRVAVSWMERGKEKPMLQPLKKGRVYR